MRLPLSLLSILLLYTTGISLCIAQPLESNKLDSAGKRHGPWYIKSKKYLVRACYNHGTPIGCWRKNDSKGRLVLEEYFSDNGLDSIIQYRKGKRFTGHCTQYEKSEVNNDVVWEVSGHCIEGRRHGQWVTADMGYLRKTHYDHGIRHGNCELFRDKDFLYKVSYTEGVLNGPAWFSTRLYQLEAPCFSNYILRGEDGYTEGSFLHGKPHGTWKHFSRGLLLYQINYLKGKPHGEVLDYQPSIIYFDSAGNQAESTQDDFRSLRTEHSTYLFWKGSYKNGLKDGLWNRFEKNGDTVLRLQYDSGSVNGTQKAFEKGRLVEEYFVDHNKLIYFKSAYQDSLQQTHTGEFEGGNGTIRFSSFSLWCFFDCAYSDYPDPRYVFGDELYSGFLEFENGRVKPGVYRFMGYFSKKEYVFTFGEKTIVKNIID